MNIAAALKSPSLASHAPTPTTQNLWERGLPAMNDNAAPLTQYGFSRGKRWDNSSSNFCSRRSSSARASSV